MRHEFVRRQGIGARPSFTISILLLCSRRSLARAFQVQIQVFLRSGARIIDAEPDGAVALHRIRIVSCPFLGGVALNHYNPLTTVAPPPAPLLPQLPGRKGDPSLYWAGSPEQMALYVPPIFHGQYLVYPPRPGIGASISSLFVSFTNSNVTDKPVQDVLSVVIRTAMGKQAPVLSLSYRFADFDVAGDTCPALRSVGTVFPTPWEINKYRKENLYP